MAFLVLSVFLSFILADSCRFSLSNIMVSANGNNFSDLDVFFLFSCLIALTRASSTMLNKNGENGHPFLFLIFEIKLSAFHL